MTEDWIIEFITSKVDSHTEWHSAFSLKDVESVYRQIETFCSENGVHFESDVDETDFEDVELSENPDEERNEVKFEIPISDSDLMLEFYYYKVSDTEYRIYFDVDFYLDDLDFDDSND